MSYATIDALRSQLGERPLPEAYVKKQLHDVPEADVVNREGFLVDVCTGKRVLEFGASGPTHLKIKAAASAYAGVDRTSGDRVVAFDLDDVSCQELPAFSVEVIICGEVLEHLSNPGWFLTRLKKQYQDVPVFITVPNAHSANGLKQLHSGIENVNRDHVCWYSYRTLRTLLERAGYRMTLVGWYNGAPRLAEGLIALAE